MPPRQDSAMDESGHNPFRVFFRDARLAFRRDELGQEIMGIAVPGALALMADPIASLVDTAFIGHIGSTELAAVGISIAVFNQVSRIAIFPLVSVTTSFVAEEDARSNGRTKAEVNEDEKHSEMEELISPEVAEASAPNSKSSSEVEVNSAHKRKHIPSVSTALLIGLSYVEACITVSLTKIYWRSSCSFVACNARSLPWTKGYKDSSVCNCGWRCNEYCFGSNIYVCVSIWCQGSSYCSCHIPCMMERYADISLPPYYYGD